MSNNNQLVVWIQEKLIPDLINKGTFLPKLEPLTEIKQCHVILLSTAEAYMLTMCYKIKIIVTDNKKPAEIGFVLKVNYELVNRHT